MEKKLDPPEHMTRASEANRNFFDTIVSGIPVVGGPLATGLRHVFPSLRDKRTEQWHGDVTDRVNDHDGQLGKHEERLDQADAFAADIHDKVDLHDQQIVEVRGSIRTASIVDDHLTVELDNYRSVINDGKPRTALGLIEKQYGRDDAAGRTSAEVQSRAKALMAFCHHQLGDDPRAAALFEDAYALDPTNPKSIANRVLGCLLVGESDRAFELASAALDHDPLNEPLAANFVHAHRAVRADGDPRDRLVEAVRQNDGVATALMQWLRHSDRPEWRDAARDCRTRFPDDEIAQTFAAEAALEETLAIRTAQERSITMVEAAAALEAARTLRGIWIKATASERVVGEVELATLHNAVLAYVVADETHEGYELALSSEQWFAQHPQLRRLAVMLAVERNEEDAVDRLLQERFDNDFDLQIERALRRGAWADALRLIEDEGDTAAARSASSLETAAACLRLMIGPVEDRATGFVDLLGGVSASDDVSANIHAWLCVARFAGRAGVSGVATDALVRAVGAVSDATPYELRVQVASEADGQDDHEAVIDLLDGHVDPTRDRPERRWLASAFAAAIPRESAVRFFGDWRATGETTFELDAVEAAFHYNRGEIQRARTLFRSAHDARPNDGRVVLALWQTLKRLNRDADARRLVLSCDPATLEGTQGDRIRFAHLMWREGRSEAFEYAYDLAVTHRDDADVCAKFAGLFFLSLGADRDPPIDEVERVAENVWVLLERKDGKPLDFVLSDDPGEPHRPLSDPIARGALGKTIGETFEIEAGPVRTEWRVAALKPKLLFLFHAVTEDFQDRFPGHPAFYSLTIKGDDLTPVLDQVKARGEMIERALDSYRENHLPLGVVAKMTGGGAIEFGQFLSFGKNRLVAAVGSPNEDALDGAPAIRAAKANGVVLDAYTAWFLSSIGRLATVTRLFPTVRVPRSVVDALNAMIADRTDLGTPRGTMGWHEGRHVFTETDPEIVARERVELERIRDEIRKLCEVVGVELGAGLPTEFRQTLTLADGALDAIVVAAREDCTLLAVDLHLRIWATGMLKVPAFGVKGLLDLARRRGALSHADRLDVVFELARHGHNHLPLNAGLLHDIYEADDTDDLRRFATVARYIGDANGEYASHVRAAAGAALCLGPDLGTDLRAQRALSIVLRMVVRLTGHSPAAIVLDLCEQVSRDPAIVLYAHGWLRGHFLLSTGRSSPEAGTATEEAVDR